MTLFIEVFWSIMPWRKINSYRCFEESKFRILQVQSAHSSGLLRGVKSQKNWTNTIKIRMYNTCYSSLDHQSQPPGCSASETLRAMLSFRYPIFRFVLKTLTDKGSFFSRVLYKRLKCHFKYNINILAHVLLKDVLSYLWITISCVTKTYQFPGVDFSPLV